MAEEPVSQYQVLLRAILHPLASTGVKDAGKVVKHLQEVFKINGAQSDLSFLKNEIFKSLELKIEIVEARKLKSMDPNGLSDPYCTLALLSSENFDEQGDIKNNNLKNKGLIRKTAVKKETLNPVWNEQFRLRINDVFTDQLLICVWDSDECMTVWENVKSVERPSGIVSLFRQVKHTIGKNKAEDEFIGVVAIPLKDIPQEGCDTWWDITTRLRKNSKVTGSLHLRLTLKQPKQERDEQLDSEMCSIEDYFCILREMHRHAASLKEGEAEFDGVLPPESKRALEMFSKQSYLIPSRVNLVRLMVLMEWNAKGCQPQVSEEAILQAFFYLEEAMSKASTWELVNDDYSLPLYFTDYELTKLDQVALAYVACCCADNGLLSDALFPLDNDVIPLLQSKLKILRKLTSLKVDQSNLTYRKELTNQLAVRLKKDVFKWLDNNIKEFSEEGRDSVLQDMTDFTMLLVELSKYCSVEPFMRLLPFEEWGFDYPLHLALAVDERIHHNCKDLIAKMDHYQNRYKNFHVNIRESSALAHTYYVTLKRLVKTLKRNASKFENKEQADGNPQLNLIDFSSWFHQGFLHLLEAFKAECYLRTTRAVQLDNRSILTSEQDETGIQFSNSAVYVLSCFAEILSEWKQLDMEHRELHLAFLVKLTDVICDATKIYSELMEKQAKRQCDKQSCGQFVIPMEVCTSINNIDHVWNYIEQLPQKMTWDHIEADSELTKQTTDVLYRLLDGAKESTTFLKEKIIENVLEEINKIAKENLRNWLKIQNQSKDADEHLSFIDKNLRILHLHTRPHVFAYALPKIWSFTLVTIKDGFQEGLRPEYAKLICKNLQVLREYLTSLGMEESCLEEEYSRLHTTLRLHSFSSVELQLQYYEELAGKVQTPIEYIGHLAFRAGYKEVTRGTIDIVVKVLNAQGLPKQDYSGLCDPFVIVELCPQAMFPCFQPAKTKTQHQTLDPVFNETFEFCDIPSTVLNIKGAVIHFLVLDRDTIGSDFTGEFFVNLQCIADVTKFISVDFLPAQMVPLKQFSDLSTTFQILEKRSQWDKHAKSFMQKRQKYSRNDGEVSVNCSPKKKLSFCGLFE